MILDILIGFAALVLFAWGMMALAFLASQIDKDKPS